MADKTIDFDENSLYFEDDFVVLETLDVGPDLSEHEEEKSLQTVDEILINIMEHYPIMYNKQLADYKDEAKKENCWRQIAQTLSLPVTATQSNWERLKAKYMRERRGLKAPDASGSAYKKKAVWPYYKTMSYLEPFITKRTSFKNPDTNPSPALVVPVPKLPISYTKSASPNHSSNGTDDVTNSVEDSSNRQESLQSHEEESKLPDANVASGSSKPVYKSDSFHNKKKAQSFDLQMFLQSQSNQLQALLDERKRLVNTAATANDSGRSAEVKNFLAYLGDLLDNVKETKKRRELQRKIVELAESYAD